MAPQFRLRVGSGKFLVFMNSNTAAAVDVMFTRFVTVEAAYAAASRVEEDWPSVGIEMRKDKMFQYFRKEEWVPI